MQAPEHRWPGNFAVVLMAAAVFFVTATAPWHADSNIRRGAALVLATLILWISEAAPLGITGLLIPVAATLAGVLKWPEALAAWGDPILFLFLGAFLLARALEKHGVFDFLLRARWARRLRGGTGAGLAIAVLACAALLSTMQSNTAVAAMLLPVVAALARTVRRPALVLLALSYGATFGGMATPIGTPPNFLGYAAMQHLDPAVNFLSWMRVGVPAAFGTTLLAWGVLACAGWWGARRNGAAPEPPESSLEDPGDEPTAFDLPAGPSTSPALRASGAARAWAIAAFGFTVMLWLGAGFVAGLSGPQSPVQAWVQRYLPESLPPILAACLLFLVRVGPGHEPVLDRRDFQRLDWDTLFLIAGGLCLGKVLQSSGAAAALAAAVGRMHASPTLLLCGLGGVTVLLSELTSNTATAALMVPIAGSLAPAVGLSPVDTIWLVSLCASLGFALPVSTPPNAIVYGTGQVPLHLMVRLGIIIDVLALTWVVLCVRWFA